jgi:hypothetical protein
MKERVSLRIGKSPIILVAPHGCDDHNTDIIADEAAKICNCYTVINRGFDRSDVVDVNNDKANCNRVDHAKEDVVYEEFLKPIIKFKNQIIKKLSGSTILPINVRGWGWNLPDKNSPKCLILYIHGAGDKVHSTANERVEVITGYGLGTKKDSLTCEMWRKNLLVDLYRNYSTDGDIFEAKGGSNYAGRSTNNMNQYFRKHELEPWVDSMQLEFPYSHRKTETRAELCGTLLGTVLTDFITYDKYDDEPHPKFI